MKRVNKPTRNNKRPLYVGLYRPFPKESEDDGARSGVLRTRKYLPGGGNKGNFLASIRDEFDDYDTDDFQRKYQT